MDYKNEKTSVPWQTMLRYIFFSIPLLILTIVLFIKQYEIPNRYVLWSILVIMLSFALVRFRRLSFILRLLTLYILLALAVEVIAFKFADEYGFNSPVFHVFIPTQLIFFSTIYFRLLSLQKYKALYLVMVSFALSSMIYYSLSLETIWGLFPSINFMLLSSFVLPLSLLYFRKMILNPVSVNLEYQPYFWFNIGTFVFFTLDFFILGFHSSLKLDVPPWMYDILWGANLAMYFPYFIAIVLDSKSKPSTS